MGLLEKALLIKEIDQSFQTIEQNQVSFYDKVKAELHLKEIRENDQYSRDKEQSASGQIMPNTIAELFAKTTQYQTSYRGCFDDENELKHVLSQTPDQGWALLVDAEQQWQAWLIIQPQKSAIHSSWKHNIEETFSWILLQQKLFKCLKPDEVSSQDEMITETPLHQLSNANIAKVPVAKPARTIQNLQLDEYDIEIHPIEDIPAFSDQLYQLHFKNLDTTFNFAEFIYLKTTNQSIIHSPIYIAEQLDEKGKFIQYLVLFGTSNIEQNTNLLHAFSEHQLRWISSIRSSSWLIFKAYFQSFEQLFECFIDKTLPIWQQEKKYAYIPASLLKKHKIIPFEEAQADVQTPLILLNDNQKFRVIHGEQRLSLDSVELAYPFIQYQRNHELNWKILQNIIQHLATPIDAVDLEVTINEYIEELKIN